MSQARLRAIYSATLPNTRIRGERWYYVAHDDLGIIANDYDVEPWRVAAVTAVLSPNVRWETNLDDAATVIEYAKFVQSGGMSELDAFRECKVSTYNNNKYKAFQIMLNTSADVVEDFVKGPKVHSFYHNLNGNLSFVTIDSHIYNAWMGYRATGSKLPGIPARSRRIIVNDISTLAYREGIEPAQMQAILWLRHIERIQLGRVDGYSRMREGQKDGD